MKISLLKLLSSMFAESFMHATLDYRRALLDILVIQSFRFKISSSTS